MTVSSNGFSAAVPAQDATGFPAAAGNTAIWRDIACIIALCGLLFALNLWGYPLIDVDEPRYAETAREMLHGLGHWVTPFFNWQTRFDKPVLFYWMIAGLYPLLGISAGTARLVSALMATGATLGVYGVARKALGVAPARWAVLVLVTMAEWTALARWSVTDMTLAAWMTLTSLGLYMGLTGHRGWYWAAGAAAGLGLLTKGPVALALPGLAWLLMLATHRPRPWKELLQPAVWGGVALALAIAAPWYWAVIRENPDFVQKFFLLHNVQRFSGTVSGHAGTWWYYVPVLLGGAFPWSLMLPTLGMQLWQHPRPRLVQYALIWALTVFVFFSASGTKLLTYILPLFPALSILLGWALDQEINFPQPATRWQPWRCKGLWLGWGLVAGALGTLIWKRDALVGQALAGVFSPGIIMVALGLMLAGFTAALVWMQRPERVRRGLLAMGMAAVAALVWANMAVWPMVAQLLQGDVMHFAQRVNAQHAPVATYGIKKPSLVFYTRQRVFYLPDELPLALVAAQSGAGNGVKPRPLYVIAKQSDQDRLFAQYPGTKLVQAGRVYTLYITPMPSRWTQDNNQ